ncbi:hypothetical protein BHYA_0016g00520 [Botrytis hyacinthi]|uniref:Uncharacterized protein n=1 Tax=Botrytis hyacinthi TaxID=278943 RepID=A0A4Z1H9K4_9HELO|nr:hypothetical protein BHYA_0016g00520 [Botrytis hyacinthi]
MTYNLNVAPEVLVANRITKYFGVTTIWSLKQQAIVAENTGYMSFFKYDTGQPANFIEAGGVYKDLYNVLWALMEKENKIAEWWERRSRKQGGRENLKVNHWVVELLHDSQHQLAKTFIDMYSGIIRKFVSTQGG